jgi:putative DNA primase/helicase
MKQVKDEWVRVRADLPDKLVKAFLERGSWGVPRLNGIVHNPYFFEGDVVSSEGYNQKSGLYLTRSYSLFIPKKASRDQASKALAHLRGILSGFPFENPIDEAVALAMMLTVIQRAMLGTAPIYLISASAPGTGKTQLLTGVASLAIGTLPAVHGFRDNEQELAKMLFSALLQGAPNIILDNVKLGVPLGGDTLNAMLTFSSLTDRELGHSRTRTVSTKVFVGATGNNLRPAADMTRRSLMCRLDAKCERPELREFDKDFIQICGEQREPILKSILIILSAYHEAGSPKVDYISLGSFEQYSAEICSPLVWLGVVDPALGLAKADADEGIAGLAELLTIWNHEITCQRKTAAELMQCPGITEYFRNEFEDRGGVTVKKVGRFLAKYAGRVVSGMRIVQDGTLHKVAVWKLEWVGG